MDTNRWRTAVARRIRTARQQADLSQTELSQHVGVSQQYISELESGDCLPSDLVRWRVADAVGVDAAVLFRYEVDDGEDEPVA